LLPKASEVLDAYLRQQASPFWTAYFVKQKDIVNDQFTQTCFIHRIDEKNEYLILRTACFPFVKYHCSKITKKEHNLVQIKLQNKFYNMIKIMNLGQFSFYS